MDESTFWSALEFRVCREFAGLRDGRRRGLWCDGFMPAVYLVADDPPRIEGEAWIGDGDRNMMPWKFTLFLPTPLRSRDEIDWSMLLPAENVTRWIAIDESRRLLQFEPAAAVPDLV